MVGEAHGKAREEDEEEGSGGWLLEDTVGRVGEGDLVAEPESKGLSFSFHFAREQRRILCG